MNKITNKLAVMLCAAALLTLAACTDNNNDTPSNSGLVKARLTADSGGSSTKADTRTSVTPDNDALNEGEKFQWNAGDKLKLMIDNLSGITLQSEFTIAPGFTGGNKADFTGSINPGVAGQMLYGLSPYSNGSFNTTQTNLPVSATQTQTNDATTNATSTAHLGANMWMYAKAPLTKDVVGWENITTATDLPHLSFKHLTALVRFRVRNAMATDCIVTQIAMTHSTNNNEKWFSIASYANLTVDPAVITPYASSGDRSQAMTLTVKNCKSLATSTAFATGNHLNAYMSLLPTVAYPNADTPDKLTITVTLAGGNTHAYTIPYATTEFLRKGLKQGMRYYFNIVIKEQGLGIESVEISDFDDAGADETITIE